MSTKNNQISTRKENYSQWYLDIIEAADLAEYGPVKGTMVIKPYGYAIWENIQSVLNAEIKATGHKNAYFPLLIPKSFFSKEASHVDGFAKECAVVTHYRLKNNQKGEIVVDESAKLEEELIIRPTSETIINHSFSQWISSWRDLPVLINQWANVLRWEMRTRPFLRTSEFLWQEGHTAHATEKEAEIEAQKMLNVYQNFVRDFLAMSVVSGKKSESEKFAGAIYTYTLEAMMQDGKSLQLATSHQLGQNFAKAFDIQFVDKENKKQYVWQTSWGMSTRSIGGLIMTHSDDHGLVLPPKIAPIQVVVVPILKGDTNDKKILKLVKKIQSVLKLKDRLEIDDRENLSMGMKFNIWEKKGVPIRIELGAKELEQNVVVLARRDTKEKKIVDIDNLAKVVKDTLVDIQTNLLHKAEQHRLKNTKSVDNWDDFKKAIENGYFVLAHWSGDPKVEEIIKKETGATIRCLPFDAKIENGTCVYSQKPSTQRALFAKTY